MLDYIRENIQESIMAKEKLLRDEMLIKTIEQVAQVCISAYQRGNKLLMCGNGGSASDALHMAGELVGRYQMERTGIAAVALNANPTVMTAIANDYEFDNIFAKQVVALGKKEMYCLVYQQVVIPQMLLMPYRRQRSRIYIRLE